MNDQSAEGLVAAVLSRAHQPAGWRWRRRWTQSGPLIAGQSRAITGFAYASAVPHRRQWWTRWEKTRIKASLFWRFRLWWRSLWSDAVPTRPDRFCHAFVAELAIAGIWTQRSVFPGICGSGPGFGFCRARAGDDDALRCRSSVLAAKLTNENKNNGSPTMGLLNKPQWRTAIRTGSWQGAGQRQRREVASW